MGNGDGEANPLHGGSGESSQSLSSEEEALVTVPLDFSVHRVSDFSCNRSPRVQGFFGNECIRFLERNYCRVFVLSDPEDSTRIFGFYTLSPGLIEKDEITKQHQKRVMPGLPIPMARVGFMGRDDTVSKELKLGGVLLRDAALRVYRCADLTAWGLYLDAENEELAKKFYEQKAGFKPTKSRPLVMYAPLKQLLSRASQSN